jgi:LacI family transcriptional regulator
MRSEIKELKYKPGDRLPSMDRLAAAYQVNKVTVRRALAELMEEGLIYAVPAQGTYVAEPPPPMPQSRPNAALTVGLLSQVMVAGNTGFYHLELIEGLRDKLARLEGNLVQLPVKYVNTHTRILEMIAQANLDALLLVGHFEPSLLKQILDGPLPAVLMDHVYRGSPVDSILVDNRGGGYQAVKHLLELGHRRIALIAGPRNEVVTEDRIQGACDALQESNLPLSTLQIVESNFLREGGFKSMATLLDQSRKPTAVFAMNDEMAAGVLQAVNALSGLNVPEDLSVIGFDDVALAMATHPPLTTVRVAKPMMGRLAVERIEALLKEKEHTPTTTVVPTQLIIRNSTGPVAGK